MKKVASIVSWLGWAFESISFILMFAMGYPVEEECPIPGGGTTVVTTKHPFEWYLWLTAIGLLLIQAGILVYREFAVKKGHKILPGILTLCLATIPGGIVTLCIPKKTLK